MNNTITEEKNPHSSDSHDGGTTNSTLSNLAGDAMKSAVRSGVKEATTTLLGDELGTIVANTAKNTGAYTPLSEQAENLAENAVNKITGNHEKPIVSIDNLQDMYQVFSERNDAFYSEINKKIHLLNDPDKNNALDAASQEKLDINKEETAQKAQQMQIEYKKKIEEINAQAEIEMQKLKELEEKEKKEKKEKKTKRNTYKKYRKSEKKYKSDTEELLEDANINKTEVKDEYYCSKDEKYREAKKLEDTAKKRHNVAKAVNVALTAVQTATAGTPILSATVSGTQTVLMERVFSPSYQNCDKKRAKYEQEHGETFDQRLHNPVIDGVRIDNNDRYQKLPDIEDKNISGQQFTAKFVSNVVTSSVLRPLTNSLGKTVSNAAARTTASIVGNIASGKENEIPGDVVKSVTHGISEEIGGVYEHLIDVAGNAAERLVDNKMKKKDQVEHIQTAKREETQASQSNEAEDTAVATDYNENVSETLKKGHNKIAEMRAKISEGHCEKFEYTRTDSDAASRLRELRFENASHHQGTITPTKINAQNLGLLLQNANG